MRQKWKKGERTDGTNGKQEARGQLYPSMSVTTLTINGLNTHSLKAQLITQSMEGLQLGETMQ